MGLSIKEVLDFVSENDVKFIRLAFCDLLGREKNISIMPSELKKAFEEGIPFDASGIAGLHNTTREDLFLVPDSNTLTILPWRPQQGRVLHFYCNIMTSEKVPFIYDSRQILKNTVEKWQSQNYVCRIGVESEFYLFKTDEDGNPTDKPLDNGGYLDIAPADKGENIRREICLSLEKMGLQPEVSHHESGPGQNEIDFRAADALATADNLLTFKNVVGAIASRNGLYASFMPKPLPGESGNGLHIHVAVYKDGVNLFDLDEGSLMYHFMAGVLDKIKDMTMFLNPTTESYKRFGEYEAPKHISWSRENHAQLIRIPNTMGKQKAVELRSPDPCLNPYLAFSLILEAGMRGIAEELPLPPAVDLDFNKATYAETKEIEMLPERLSEAITYTEKSAFVRETLGGHVVRQYIACKERTR